MLVFIVWLYVIIRKEIVEKECYEIARTSFPSKWKKKQKKTEQSVDSNASL